MKRGTRVAGAWLLAAGAVAVLAGGAGTRVQAQTANRAPVFSEDLPGTEEPIVAKLGKTIELTIDASDPDGDTVSLTAAGVPRTASFSPELPAVGSPVSSVFTWTPQAGEEGIYELHFTAADPNGGSTTQTVRILASRIGICADGRVGGKKGLEFLSSVGFPRGSKKIQGYIKVFNRATKARLTATQFDSLEVRGNVARVSGLATLKGKGQVPFEMIVQDNGRRDYLTELIVDGTLWGEGPMAQGSDVHFHSNKDWQVE